MSTTHKQERYSSKFPILQHIFDELTNHSRNRIGENLLFTHSALERAYRATGITRPTSSSNFILDLTRKNRGITKRLPAKIIELGYDLRHTTGRAGGRENYSGEFIYVGYDNTLQDWLDLTNLPETIISIRANATLKKILPFLRRDEAALFSVLDYCDVLSYVIHNKPKTVFRVQCPVKWQPNEVDGLYFSDYLGQQQLFPIEAKALSTVDDIYLPQIFGASELIRNSFENVQVIPLGIKMVADGFLVAQFRNDENQKTVALEKLVRARIIPPIPSWQRNHALQKKKQSVQFA